MQSTEFSIARILEWGAFPPGFSQPRSTQVSTLQDFFTSWAGLLGFQEYEVAHPFPADCRDFTNWAIRELRSTVSECWLQSWLFSHPMLKQLVLCLSLSHTYLLGWESCGGATSASWDWPLPHGYMQQVTEAIVEWGTYTCSGGKTCPGTPREGLSCDQKEDSILPGGAVVEGVNFSFTELRPGNWWLWWVSASL